MVLRARDAHRFDGIVALITVALSFGCGPSDKATRAGVGLGLAVAAAGINRAATGECWGSCAPGQACDRDSGVCVPIPCGGKCPPDHRCVTSTEGDRCERRAAESAEPVPVVPTEDPAPSVASAEQTASAEGNPSDAGVPEDAGAGPDGGREEEWDADAGGYPPPPPEWGPPP